MMNAPQIKKKKGLPWIEELRFFWRSTRTEFPETWKRCCCIMGCWLGTWLSRWARKQWCPLAGSGCSESNQGWGEFHRHRKPSLLFGWWQDKIPETILQEKFSRTSRLIKTTTTKALRRNGGTKSLVASWHVMEDSVKKCLLSRESSVCGLYGNNGELEILLFPLIYIG